MTTAFKHADRYGDIWRLVICDNNKCYAIRPSGAREYVCRFTTVKEAAARFKNYLRQNAAVDI